MAHPSATVASLSKLGLNRDNLLRANRPLRPPTLVNRPMSERGKYHGQPLKAKDVLRLYAAGERDFRGTILRGCNFQEADLSGADFTGADIRSARFVDANLQKAKFCYAQGGLQRRWMAGQVCLIGLIASLAGVLQGFSGGLLGAYFQRGIEGDIELLIAAIARGRSQNVLVSPQSYHLGASRGMHCHIFNLVCAKEKRC
jgi:hypothetical protein